LRSPKVSRSHVYGAFDPQVRDVDVPRLSAESAARIRPAAMLCLIAPAMRQPQLLVSLADLPKQAGEVSQVLGNDVDDFALALNFAVTADHARRQNEPALLLEQRRPDDQVGDLGVSGGRRSPGLPGFIRLLTGSAKL
jgi:hypothetical protein